MTRGEFENKLEILKHDYRGYEIYQADVLIDFLEKACRELYDKSEVEKLKHFNVGGTMILEVESE